jgi:hypothetical protein
MPCETLDVTSDAAAHADEDMTRLRLMFSGRAPHPGPHGRAKRATVWRLPYSFIAKRMNWMPNTRLVTLASTR